MIPTYCIEIGTNAHRKLDAVRFASLLCVNDDLFEYYSFRFVANDLFSFVLVCLSLHIIYEIPQMNDSMFYNTLVYFYLLDVCDCCLFVVNSCA